MGATGIGGLVMYWNLKRRNPMRRLRYERELAAKSRGTHTKEEWAALVSACGGVCVRCGQKSYLMKDHVVPICRDGSDSIDNLQPLCARCNSRKGAGIVDFVPFSVRQALRHSAG